jgi:hypothetical protein
VVNVINPTESKIYSFHYGARKLDFREVGFDFTKEQFSITYDLTNFTVAN